jgi:hypothetical protein
MVASIEKLATICQPSYSLPTGVAKSKQTTLICYNSAEKIILSSNEVYVCLYWKQANDLSDILYSDY